MKPRLITRENLWAVVFCLILVALIILSTSNAPVWIYQGF